MKIRAAVELLVAVAALVAAGFSWMNTRSTIAVAPVVDGAPTTFSEFYDAPQLVLTLSLVTLAGILAVLAVTRLRRIRVAQADFLTKGSTS